MKVVKLGDYIEEYSKKNTEEKDITVYSVTNEEGFCTGYFSKDVSSKDKHNYKIVPYGYFAYNPSRINVGSIDWQRVEEQVLVSPLYVVFKIKKDIEKQYLFYYLKSDIAKLFIKNMAMGSVRDNLKFSILKKFPFNLRSLEEQKAIVNKIDRINILIEYSKQLKDMYNKLIKSRFIEMFGDITEKIALKESCTLHARIGWQALTKKEHQKIGDYMLVTGTDFIDGKIDFSNCVYISKNRYDMDENIQIKNDDILITKDGTIGKVAIVEKLPMPATLNAGIFVVRPDKRFNKEYISYVFKGPLFEQFVNRVKTGSTIKHLNQGKLVQFEIPLPDMDMQNEFAKLYMQIGKSELAVKSSLEKLETLKKSLMQQYFG